MEFDLETGPISEETRKIAEAELRETPEVVQKALAELRELIKNDKTIRYGDDDEFLTIFLRPCKWYPQSAYQLVSNNFTLFALIFFYKIFVNCTQSVITNKK